MATGMEPEMARRLFAEGALLVLLGVPARTEVGIDCQCWRVGPRFKGVKMIPPGFHFVYYSAVSKEGQAAPRTGFFHFFQRQEVLVRRWDPKTEELMDGGVTADIVEGFRAGVQELDQFLGPYPFDSLKRWVSLSSHVSEPLLLRLQPLNGTLSSVAQLQTEEKPVSMDTGTSAQQPGDGDEDKDEGVVSGSVADQSEEESDFMPGGHFAGVGEFPPSLRQSSDMQGFADLPNMKRLPETALRFSTIPKQLYPPGSTPAQITHHNLDRSYSLRAMLSSEKDLLGELQFAFVCFLVGQVYDAFEHWKQLVRLLCSCEEALTTHKELFSGFISVLHFQLKEVPDDFFVDIISRNNFLTTTLQSFFSTLEQSSTVDQALVKRGLQFRESLTKKYSWDFSSEPEDYAPTVVDAS